MDNPYYAWSPIINRPFLQWPGGARVAVCVIVSLEHLEVFPDAAFFVPPSAVLSGPYPAVFDIHEISHHEYGNRVGIFRVMSVLDKHGVKGTVALDGKLALANPYLVEECRKRGWEFIGHGRTFSEMITEAMTDATERELIADALGAIEHATGVRPVGWIGADYGESTRTVRLLAEMGVRYVCDWPNDEQPYFMDVPTGQMTSLPVSIELDQVYAERMRRLRVDQWCNMVKEAFDRLYVDGTDHGRLLVLNLHPYLTGQPFRIKYLDSVLTHIQNHEHVWCATGREIVDWYVKQHHTNDHKQ